jgi:Centromere DNA-binding protein complex CBF3 subunit, domain 2
MHCMLLRSETTRDAELSDFESIPLTNEGPEDAFAVIMRQRGGKTKDRKDGSTNRKTHYHGFLRHKNTFLCPVGALARWFLYRWEITRETPPDFRSRESWYQIPLLPKTLKKLWGRAFRAKHKVIGSVGCLKRWIFHLQNFSTRSVSHRLGRWT